MFLIEMNTNPRAKRILCYGDSYTFGWMSGQGRYPSDKRYTGILQDLLGSDFELLEEGLRGRTLSGDNPFFPYRNGSQQFDGIVGSHMPLDLIVLFLGTNDMNAGFQKTAKDIYVGLEYYKKHLAEWSQFFGYQIPKVLLLCPPYIDEQHLFPTFKDIFVGGEIKSKQLPLVYKQFALENGREYYDTNEIVRASSIDGIHIDEEDHKKLATVLSSIIRSFV